MRMGLTCFILRQFMVIGRLSIAIADGPMQHIKACDSAPDVAIVHSIGVSGTPRRCNRWINKYIFPGGYLPALEQVTAAASQQGLKILDIEITSGHDEEMLKHFRRAFFANIAAVRRNYDERFIRM